VFVQPATELGSLAQQWSFNQNDVVTLTDRYRQLYMNACIDTCSGCHCEPEAIEMYWRVCMQVAIQRCGVVHWCLPPPPENYHIIMNTSIW